MNQNPIEEGLDMLVQFDKRGGLVPGIVQDYSSGEILMLAYINREAFDETLKSGYATFWSTSRNELWKKGETSGDYLAVQEVLVDCDQDTLVFKVKMLGNGVCHTKMNDGEPRRTDFYRRLNDENYLEFLEGME
jgi:phosphoribosyl-AMP cyclohydrolase